MSNLINMLEEAVAHHQAGRFGEAEALYLKVLDADPDNTFANHLYGVIAIQKGDPQTAIGFISKSLAKEPGNVEARKNLASALIKAGNFPTAEEHLLETLKQKPDYPEALNNLSVVQKETGRLTEACDSARKAIRLKPDFAEAYNSLGNALMAVGEVAEAERSYQQTLQLNPANPEGWNNLGLLAKDNMALEQAEACFSNAIQLKPDFADAHNNLGMLFLLQGRLIEGFAECEWRSSLASQKLFQRELPGKEWKGENLGGKRLFVYAEQGLGDTLQFVRYLTLLAGLGCEILFECQPKLVRLLSKLDGPTKIIGRGEELPEFDLHVSLMSLPYMLATSPDTIPAVDSYLSAEPDLIEQWKARIGGSGFSVGIAWQGNPNASIDKGRSLPLACLAPLASVAGIRLISLQKHDGLDQLSGLPEGMTVETLGDVVDSGADAFIDTAGIMKNLDLVITSDTAIAHLAGALGCPTWVVLRKVPDWRWLLDRDDSPWYPAMRLFRQDKSGDWIGVVERVCQELQRLSK